jgi:triosephosphate isomerase
MHLNRAQSVALAAGVAEHAKSITSVDIAVFPPSVYLDAVRQALVGTSVAWGAQNIYHEPQGAFTGEISAAMLVDLGCRYVILGHSERRHVLGETDEQVNRKVLAALDAGLTPIVCVGETLAEREAGRTLEAIDRQFTLSLAGLTAQQMQTLVLAYEPVWAIGTGKVATPDQAEEVHADLRRMLSQRYNSQVAEQVRIQYGGSVKPENVRDLLSKPNVDGALVGGASLKEELFLTIVRLAVDS